MEILLEGLPGWFLLFIATLIGIAILVLLTISIRTGREVTFWPPRIGPAITPSNHPVTTHIKEELSNSPLPDLAIHRSLPNLLEVSKLMEERSFSAHRIRVFARSWHSSTKRQDLCDKLAQLRETSVCILLLHPKSKFVEQRSREAGYKNPDQIRREITSSVDRLTDLKTRCGLEHLHVRYYDAMPVFRFVLVDEKAFLSFYPRSAPGTSIPVVEIGQSPVSLWNALDRYFEYLWAESNEAT